MWTARSSSARASAQLVRSRRCATATRQAVEFQEGTTLHGFRVNQVVSLPRYDVTAVLLQHESTGASWLHLDADDANNAFCVSFKTPPTDSTGIAHVLEHTVLCGSRSYPVRDPFFNMQKRSLASYMNALTGSDYTMYPFASQHHADYKNLMGVYLDATFFPLLRELDFKQEGHRLEFEQPTDAASRLMIKGVVFNEMKGAMQSHSARFSRAMMERLYPSSCYQHSSGGDPLRIPDLTLEALREFHSSHYHPSNALFYSYGNNPLDDTLATAQSSVLEHFEPLPQQPSRQREQRWAEPRTAEVTLPGDPGSDPAKPCTVSVAWLLPAELSPLEQIGVRVIADLLVSGPEAAFYEPLVASELGAGLAPGTGYGGGKIEESFAVGLKHVAREDVQEVLQRVHSTLERACQEGFDLERIDAIVHQVQLGARDVSTGFGLNSGLSCSTSWAHTNDPLLPLRTPELVEELQRAVQADPEYLQQLLKRVLVENPHRLSLVGTATSSFHQELDQAEGSALAEQHSAMSPEERAALVLAAEALQAEQDAPGDASVLPCVTVAGAVSREACFWDSEHSLLEGTPGVAVQLDQQPTNGVVYTDAVFDASALPARLVPYLPYMTSYFTALGTTSHSFQQLARFERQYTAGVGASFSTRIHPTRDGALDEASVWLTGGSLDENTAPLFELLADLTASGSVQWEQASDRLGEMLQRRGAALSAGLANNGSHYASSRVDAQLIAAGGLDDLLGGLPHVAHAAEIAARIARGGEHKEGAVREVGSACAAICAHVFSKERLLRVRGCGSSEVLSERVVPGLEHWASALPEGPSQEAGAVLSELWCEPPEPSAPEFIAVPSQTNYVIRGFKTVPPTHPDAPSLVLLSRVIASEFLHREVREKGGAYGGGAVADSASGTFSMSSYRDPRQLETLKCFERAVEWGCEEVTDEHLEQAQLQCFKSLDGPTAPKNRGLRQFRQPALTNAMRQRFREGLLDADPASVMGVARKYLGDGAVDCVVGNVAQRAGFGDEWKLLDTDLKPLE